jgi:CRISPR/Cas system-associated endoribonuclease Cas2
MLPTCATQTKSPITSVVGDLDVKQPNLNRLKKARQVVAKETCRLQNTVFAQLYDATTTTDKKLKYIEERLDQLVRRSAETNERLDEMSTTVNDRFNSADSRSTAMESRFEAMKKWKQSECQHLISSHPSYTSC